MNLPGGPPVSPSRYVVMLSGGLDSAVNLLMARRYGLVELAITVDYGQRSAAREMAKARELTETWGIEHLAVDARWLDGLAGTRCALFPGGPDLPEMTASEVAEKASEETAALVWVPNRNGLLANIGACAAEARGAGQVIFGFNREEAATFPDNSGSFVHALNQALAFSTRNGVRVASFTVNMEKVDIVEAALDLGLDWGQLWSCYNGADEMCGCCESCARLSRAVREAGVAHLVESLFRTSGS